MFLYFLISMLCAILIPGVIAYFAGQIIVGPLLWAQRSFRLHENNQRLLGPGFRVDLVPTKDPEVRAKLNQVALTSWSARARDFEGQRDGLRVLLRTQPRTVGPDGEPLRFPWTRKERSEAQQVLGLGIVIDTAGRLPEHIDLHVALGRDDSVVGDEALAAALLDDGVRQWTCPGDQLTISDQLVGYDSPLGMHRAEPDRLIMELVRMTHRLLAAIDEEGRIDRASMLLHNARHDTRADVRAAAVDMLLRWFPSVAEAAFATALDDPAPAVRFAAARHLAEDGFEFVLAVLEDERSPEGLRERALRYMIRNFSRAQVLPILEDIVQNREGNLRNIAVRHLGELRHEPAIAWLKAIAPGADPRTAVDIATALAAIGGAEATPILIDLLKSPELDVQLAAVDALGWVGELPSVEHLLPISRSRLIDARLQLAASTAVRMIQGRRARTGSGALSMVDGGDVGGVSLAAPEGAVALAPDDDSPANAER